jgi:hypothetical protein
MARLHPVSERQAGDVFLYPYLWSQDHARGIDNPKARTACLVFKTRDGAGITQMVILAISDSAGADPEASIAVPDIEMRRGGLNVARKAYVHLGEYNLDALPYLTVYEPSAPTLGRFSRSFTQQIARGLSNRIKARQSARFTRT